MPRNKSGNIQMYTYLLVFPSAASRFPQWKRASWLATITYAPHARKTSLSKTKKGKRPSSPYLVLGSSVLGFFVPPHSARVFALKYPSQPLKYLSQPLKYPSQPLKKRSTLALANPARSPQHPAAKAFTNFTREKSRCHLSLSHLAPPALPVPRSAFRASLLPLRLPHSLHSPTHQLTTHSPPPLLLPLPQPGNQLHQLSPVLLDVAAQDQATDPKCDAKHPPRPGVLDLVGRVPDHCDQ